MQGGFNLDEWDDHANYMVFDDVPWKYLPSKKSFLGGQLEFVVTDKYRKKRTVHFGLATIYSMNDDNYREIIVDPMWEWLTGNCVVVFIENKLFN